MKVDPKGTTQICSNCRKEVTKRLWNRTHKCSCGLEIERDYNSAINILNRALNLVGQELSEHKPVGDCVRPICEAVVNESGRSALNG